MEVSREERERALARAAQLKSRISDFLTASDKIPTGLQMIEELGENRRHVMDVMGASEEDWTNYRWHIKNRISDVETLSKIAHLGAEESEGIRLTSRRYRWAVSPYYASLMKRTDRDCPIRKQAIPSIEEIRDTQVVKDPMILRNNSPAPLISRLYPDRLIINVTNTCATFCRHCLRRKDIGHRDMIYSGSMLDQALDYVRKNEEIRDVLITGGDALALEDDLLDEILGELDAIPHMEIKRLGSRMPCVLPQRVSPQLCRILEKHDPVYILTQFNHPKEITAEAKKAVDDLTRVGVVVGNQAVLLKGINNDPSVMKKLMHELLRIKVRPYYLFNCKKVEGIGHLRTSIQEGLNIMEHLRGYTSGLAVPTYIITAPQGRGKVPLAPQYILNTNFKGDVLVRSWEGHSVRYEDEGSP
jgi:lysine 2,3-aminomutase